jgi:hypothetical protein
VYAEYYDTNAEQEISTTFNRKDRKAYTAFVQQQEQVRAQSPRKRQQAQGRRKARAGQLLHVRVLQRSRHKESLRTRW